MSQNKQLTAQGQMRGFGWQFPGGAESSYRHMVKEIADDPRLSRRRKQELIDGVTYLVAHVISDADFQIRSDYTQAHSGGIRWMRWREYARKPGRLFTFLFGDILRDLRMQVHLNDLSCLHNITQRMKRMQETLNTRVLNKA